ncbi:hypothetical protein OH492_19155 [Vibrio chagasii]|nr:hypothetical protein [Vibrio chagasii]
MVASYDRGGVVPYFIWFDGDTLASISFRARFNAFVLRAILIRSSTKIFCTALKHPAWLDSGGHTGGQQ